MKSLINYINSKLVEDGIVRPGNLQGLELPVEFHDRTRTASKQHVRTLPRLWRSVTGICLHQTACLLGERPARWDTVGAHVGVTRGGKVLKLHEFNRVVYHGNGWNNGTVGIEIDGLYAGVEGRPETVWDDPGTTIREQGMELTPEAIVAARAAIRWICYEVAQHGGRIKALVAHRQASKNRRNDPGSAIWQEIAIPLHKELGLSEGGFGFTLGNGLPIPYDWNPDSGYRY